MLTTVDLSNPKPVYLQITDAVRTAIARGSLQAGDRLPTIRETAVQTRVNRNTMSRAYLELEHEGLVRARQGSGFYVTDDGAERERSIRQDALHTQVRTLTSGGVGHGVLLAGGEAGARLRAVSAPGAAQSPVLGQDRILARSGARRDGRHADFLEPPGAL